MRSKKILLTIIIAIVALLTMSSISKAATVKITADVINVREEASTSSDVIAKLSKGVECEYLGEEGDWYKVTYGRYTGYVSKEYSELIEDSSDDEADAGEETTDNSSNEDTDTTATESAETEATEEEVTTQAEETTTEESTESDDNTDATAQIVYKKFNQTAVIRISPLIYSGNIGEAKTNDEVLVLTEASGWSYVQTDEISGWVRTDTLDEIETSNDDDDEETTEQIGYISESSVNMRKGAGTTYSVIKKLSLNTQVTILGEEDGWYKVEVGDTTGYVSKDYVSDSKKDSN